MSDCNKSILEGRLMSSRNLMIRVFKELKHRLSVLNNSLIPFVASIFQKANTQKDEHQKENAYTSLSSKDHLNHKDIINYMGKSGRDWTQIYAIYGMDDWQTPVFLLIHAIIFSLSSVLFLIYFDTVRYSFELIFPGVVTPGFARFAAGFTGSVTAISGLCMFYAAGNIFYSSVALHWEMAQRMVSAVYDWSTVKTALDVGCGRGILLNAVAMQLKKEGSSGRVVGLDRKNTTLATLRTAGIEGVQEYVTCREGDARRLPFSDEYFDVVVSAGFVHTVGKEFGQKTAAASAERMRVIGEVVRVLKGGGVGVVWDMVHVPEYVQRLHELKMEDIRVSESVTAFMVSSHIVSFRKPCQHVVGPSEVRLDWRFNGVC